VRVRRKKPHAYAPQLAAARNFDVPRYYAADGERKGQEKKIDHLESPRYFNGSAATTGVVAGGGDVVLLGTWQNPLVSFASSTPKPPREQSGTKLLWARRHNTRATTTRVGDTTWAREY